MAIAFRASGAWAPGINSFANSVPAAQLTGDMMLFIGTCKPFDGAMSTIWTDLGSAASGTTASAVDLGSMKIQVWYKIATSDTETNLTLTEGSPTWSVAAGVIYVFSKGASETWSTPVVVFGADETDGTALSFTYASDPGGIAGDYVCLACGMNTDAATPLTTDLVPVWTGITFGTADPGIEGGSNTGDDWAAHVMSRPVSSGTSSAAPTSTGTATGSGAADRAESCFVRLRVVTQTTQTQLAKARITDQVSQTQLAKARITDQVSQTQVAKARITDQVSQTQLAKARITDQVSQLQTAKANISAGVTTTQTQLAKARITDQVSQTQLAKARITDQVLQLQTALARITDQVETTQVAKARITDQVSQVITAKAALILQTSRLQSALARITDQVTQTIGAKAYIGSDAPGPVGKPVSVYTSYHYGFTDPELGSEVTPEVAQQIHRNDHRYMRE